MWTVFTFRLSIWKATNPGLCSHGWSLVCVMLPWVVLAFASLLQPLSPPLIPAAPWHASLACSSLTALATSCPLHLGCSSSRSLLLLVILVSAQRSPSWGGLPRPSQLKNHPLATSNTHHSVSFTSEHSPLCGLLGLCLPVCLLCLFPPPLIVNCKNKVHACLVYAQSLDWPWAWQEPDKYL